MKKIFSKEVIIGFLVLVAIAVLVIGIDFLKGVNVFQKSNSYSILFDNVQGLAVSAPVNVNGFKVGQVRDITYEYNNPGHIRVLIEVDDELRLPQGTKAFLESDLLGTAAINLKLGTSSTMIEQGSEMIGEVPSGMMDKLSSDLLPAVSEVFPKVDSLLTNINSLVADPALKQSVQRLDILTSNLVQTTQNLNAVIATLPPITQDAKQITGNFAEASDDVKTLTHNLNELPLDSLVLTLQQTLENLQQITSELNEGMNSTNSSIGKLMNDPALYDNLNGTIQSLDSLFIDIKKNPKRYISIKLL